MSIVSFHLHCYCFAVEVAFIWMNYSSSWANVICVRVLCTDLEAKLSINKLLK